MTARDVAIDPLVSAPVGRLVLRLGLPLALGMASHAAVNLVDLAMVGRLGADAVAAAHVASTINFLPMIVGNAVSVAALSILSRHLGAGNRVAAATFARGSLLLMLWLGTAISVLTALPAAPCVDSTGVSGRVRFDAIHYLVISNLGCLPMFALMQATALMRAVGEVWMPLGLLIGANLVNLGLDIVLIFGWPQLGVPAIGVVGAAYATAAARTLAAVAGLAWLGRRRHPLALRAVTGLPQRDVWRPLWQGAWPQTVQIALRAGLVWGLTVIVQQKSGSDGVAALGVTTRLDTMILFAGVGFASAATTVAGRAVVLGQTARARAAGVFAGVQALFFGGLLVATFQAGAVPLLRSFLPGAADPVVDAGILYLTVAAAAQPFAACALGAMGAVHGAGRMLAPLFVDLIGFGVLSAALLLATRLELRSVYEVLVAGAVLVALLHLVFLGLGRWTVPVGEPSRN